MSKKLSVFEFSVKCSDLGISKFVYATSNQPPDTVRHGMSVSSVYSSCRVFLPGEIVFSGIGGSITFSLVKYITYERIGTMCYSFSLVCGPSHTEEYDIRYVMVGSEK